MTDEIKKLLDDYWAWLRDKTSLRQVDGDWYEITTPYLDRHNDYIQLYVHGNGAGWLLSDGGETIGDLEQSGCALDSAKRQALLKMTLAGFGVQMGDDKALQARASASEFSLRKHNLLQAILAVNDLFYLAAPITRSLFFEDVVAWLDSHEVRYTPKVKFTGKSGYDHVFDFVVPKSRVKPERIIRAIATPDRERAESIAFAWLDTREVRASGSRAYALLNDTDHAVASSVIDALRSYDVTPVLWSDREKAAAELAA